jgi:cysteine dioxygenase
MIEDGGTPVSPTLSSADPAKPCSCRDATTRYPKLAELVGYLESLKGRADLGVLSRLLTETRLSRADIESTCIFNPSGYKRNTIARTEWFELLALCWRSGHCTPIHDHAGVSCAFKVVEGTGTEIRFAPTPSGLICPVRTNAMVQGYVCAAEDADIHQVANMQSPGLDLVTLHIYSPPITKMKTYKFAVSDGAECGKYEC